MAGANAQSGTSAGSRHKQYVKRIRGVIPWVLTKTGAVGEWMHVVADGAQMDWWRGWRSSE
jgi:hypothetical protein